MCFDVLLWFILCECVCIWDSTLNSDSTDSSSLSRLRLRLGSHLGIKGKRRIRSTQGRLTITLDRLWALWQGRSAIFEVNTSLSLKKTHNIRRTQLFLAFTPICWSTVELLTPFFPLHQWISDVFMSRKWTYIRATPVWSDWIPGTYRVMFLFWFITALQKSLHCRWGDNSDESMKTIVIFIHSQSGIIF